MWNILVIHFSTNFVASRKFTSRFWKIPIHIQPCGCLVCTTSEIKPWILIPFFVAAFGFGGLKCLTQDFHWGFRKSSLKKFGPTLISESHVVGCTTIFKSLISNRTIYLGFLEISLVLLVLKLYIIVYSGLYIIFTFSITSVAQFWRPGRLASLFWSDLALASLINESHCNFHSDIPPTPLAPH